MMSTPQISIITVCFNAGKEIEPTILSVLKLLDSRMEYIIIDGGSVDETVNIIQKYDDKITWKSESDLGIYDAMNKGLQIAKGIWAIFINCGDLLYQIPDVLFDQNSLRYYCVFASVEVEGGKIIYPKFNNTIYLHNTIPHQGLFYNIKQLRVQFCLNYKIFADYNLNFELYKRKIPYMILDDVVAFHSLTGISNNRDALKELEDVVRNNGGFLASIMSKLYFLYHGIVHKLTHWIC